ncbi:DUF3263 domain-containing protein [Brachybacterium sacelli]|uniref:DUF3263 domain-containing protein n=1 Tax=Brachybacterium sacelli TaxID=173364 RepID=A0ABS4X0C5_9MICO|nr:DUF3263 domain-containing protein [Brachybacterium sacelli]MBP2381843.1 hypothetical protein [Brachybacterium sacelli]
MPSRPAGHPDGAARSAETDGTARELADPTQDVSGPDAGADDTPAMMSDTSLPGPQGALTDRDRQILGLESRTFRYVGAKERAIREEIGISKVAYYVRLNALLDDPAALRAAPAVVNRLRGRRTSDHGPDAADGSGRVA